MSDRSFERAVSDWLDDGVDRTPKHAVEGVLLAIKTTPQERDLRIPWRFPQMTGLSRAIAIAALTLVVVVGGGALYLTGGAVPPASPSPSPSPSPSLSVDVPAGFSAFTSLVYGYTLVYPEGWEVGIATDNTESDEFVNADNDFGVAVSKASAGTGADLATLPGLTAWARSYCIAHSLGACDTYADRVETMCLRVAGDRCKPAILVHSKGENPEAEGEYAFFGDWANAGGGAPDSVVVLGAGRGDAYPGAAPFGGARNLLKTMLASMGVTPSAGPDVDVTPGPSDTPE